MGKIKFRAWDGKLMHIVGELSWSMGGLKFYGPGYGSGICYVNPDFNEWGGEQWKVDSILMQYTGLLDKTGKEIWGGDIVNLTSIDITGRRTTEVIFHKGSFRERYMGYELGNYKEYEIEVIGNIYENPELLK